MAETNNKQELTKNLCWNVQNKIIVFYKGEIIS